LIRVSWPRHWVYLSLNMKYKMIFFDCDGTLWESVDGDYISSVVSGLRRLGENTIARLSDGKVFYLKKNVRKLMESLFNEGACIGIVSDNISGPVMEAIFLFGLEKYIDQEAINVRLWKGHCRKDQMILEILAKKKFQSVPREKIVLVDDKDYEQELKKIGVGYINSEKLFIVK